MAEGPRYDWAARAASEIVNIHFRSDECTAVVFGQILFCILFAMYAADEEMDRFNPSNN